MTREIPKTVIEEGIEPGSNFTTIQKNKSQ